MCLSLKSIGLHDVYFVQFLSARELENVPMYALWSRIIFQVFFFKHIHFVLMFYVKSNDNLLIQMMQILSF